MSISLEGTGYLLKLRDPSYVTVVKVSPRLSIAPFTSIIVVDVNKGARLGLYPFELSARDTTTDKELGKEHLALLVLGKEVPTEIARHYKTLRRLYQVLGAQAVIWYLLMYVSDGAASFTQLKKAYEAVRSSPVRNAIIATILRRMIRKKIISKRGDGKYSPPITKFKVLKSG